MKMKKLSWRLRSGNKGFILTIDITVAVLLAMILISFSYYYSQKSDDNPLSGIQIVQTTSDIAALLDNSRILNALDQNQINAALNRILPVNYGMNIDIGCTISSLVVGDDIPEDQDIKLYSVKRYFVTGDNSVDEFCYARYIAWLK